MKILLVDDQGIIRESLALQIKLLDDSYDVSSCGSVEQARILVESLSPEIIFLDCALDGDREAGLRFLDELKDAGCMSRIVMLSGEDDPQTVGRAIGSGAVGFITKSGRDPSSMHRAIETALQGGVYISEELRGRPTRPPAASGRARSDAPVQIREVGPEDIGIPATAARIYETLWWIANGTKGYKRVAQEMKISDGVVEGYARDGYNFLQVEGKSDFLVTLARKGWRLKTPPSIAKSK